MLTQHSGCKGREALASAYREIWLVDFEFRADPDERPYVVCMVAREFSSGREYRLWRGDLLQRSCAPFNVGPDCLFVSFFASAELGCFLQLGWPLPVNVLDLYVEHRNATNGLNLKYGSSLLGALALHGLAGIETGQKDRMRELIMTRGSWSADEQKLILAYCASDVLALAGLLAVMADHIDLPRALWRGRYMMAVARMEQAGVPLDRELVDRLQSQSHDLKRRLIADVDTSYGVYDNGVFKRDQFELWLRERGIPWPRHPSRALNLTADAFSDQAKRWPLLQDLRDLRATLGKMQLTGLTVGRDGRNRGLLSPFRSITGRNQPSTSKFVFGPSRWIRGLIKPPAGYGLASIDFVAQEIGIAAALSKDQALIEAYLSGDPYLGFAKQAGLAPPDATKETHGLLRERCKQFVLGVNYGMGAASLAFAANITEAEARSLLLRHRARSGGGPKTP